MAEQHYSARLGKWSSLPYCSEYFSLPTRVRMCGWRLHDFSLVTQLKPWWPRLCATCHSLSASTSELQSWRQMSGPRNESSGRVRLLHITNHTCKNSLQCNAVKWLSSLCERSHKWKCWRDMLMLCYDKKFPNIACLNEYLVSLPKGRH